MSESSELLELKYIISDKTHYGVIWKGSYDGDTCIVKVVVLNTGVHYDKRTGKYYDGERRISRRTAGKVFAGDFKAPYLHSRYREKKAMDVETFNRETEMMKTAGKLRLAPKLLDYWGDRTTYRIHYGVIVMERLSMTVKDILLERDLGSDELDTIQLKIRKLHERGIRHGDLKPSNIAVNCDSKGVIRKVRIIDWAKGEYTDNKKLFDNDIGTFHQHMRKNIRERSK